MTPHCFSFTYSISVKHCLLTDPNKLFITGIVRPVLDRIRCVTSYSTVLTFMTIRFCMSPVPEGDNQRICCDSQCQLIIVRIYQLSDFLPRGQWCTVHPLPHVLAVYVIQTNPTISSVLVQFTDELLSWL